MIVNRVSPPVEEGELLDHLRAGEEQAWEELVTCYAGPLYAVTRRYLRCDEDRADAVQGAFLAAFRALDSFQGECKLWTWLYRIVVNVSLMKLRGQARRPVVCLETLSFASAQSGLAESSAQVAGAETRDQVRACIERLPAAYRTVVLLRDIEELDTVRTAERLGISAGAVKTRLHRARQALRRLLVARNPHGGRGGTSLSTGEHLGPRAQSLPGRAATRWLPCGRRISI
jgi:RNA polymerase sigma-70 factor (ECF subfamily)